MTLPIAAYDALLTFADRLADAARAEILPRFRVGATAENKAARGFDPVTEADRAAERAMRDLIEATYPDHGIMGEEYGDKPARGGPTWVLDPIDGTRAFICGVPTWGVLIGLVDDGRPVLGVIDQPYLDERYRGFPGGATLTSRGRAQDLRVSPCARLTEARLSTTDQNLFSPAEAGGFEHLRATARLTRYGLDCYAYARLAAGDFDLVVESGLKPHDVAALVPVIEGAGGLVTNWAGGAAWPGGQIIAAGDERPHAEALVSLRRCAAPRSLKRGPP